MSHPTNTSRWSLVIQHVGPTTAEVWVGTLFGSMKMPDKARVTITDKGGGRRNLFVTKEQWQRPFPSINQRFYALKRIKNLKPNSRYEVGFERQVKGSDGKVAWQPLRTGAFETLPKRLPMGGKRPFTVALASCFYDHRDGGSAAAAYKALYDRGADGHRPHLKFLTGDQVYLDIGFDSLSPRTRELRERIADDYAKHWQSLGSILTRGGAWMLPDDHEYWNDYPFYDTPIPTLQMLRVAAVRNAWQETAKEGVRNVQRSPVVERMDIGKDLSICIADLRSYRGVHDGKPVMMHPKAFPKLLHWARSLKSPGVLVTSQPLIVEKSKERNLLSFPSQYRDLLLALGETGHDIVLLSGDAHFGRIATCKLGPNGGRLIEIISSPLSNLTGLSGFSTAAPKHKPKKFPHASVKPNEWKSEFVHFSKDFSVQTRKGFLFSAYPKVRTREHFMTVSFSRLAGGAVRVSAQCFHVRERGGPKFLPVKGFKRPFTKVLY